MTITRQQVDAWDDEVDAAYKRGLHDGMKQERALWTLSKLGQEIEAQPERDPWREAVAQPATDMAYTIALQRAIEWHCEGKAVPPDVAALCPYHAEMLNKTLVQPDNTAKMYEELRSIIDGGSESFTHEDAVQYLKDNLAPLKWTPKDTAYRPGGLAQRGRAVFPTMLRKMWSGSEVQAWLDENVNKEKNT